MSRRKLRLLILALLVLALVPAVYAMPPTSFDDGWWGNARFDNGNVLFDFVVPSIDLTGTSTQPAGSPGRAVKGVFRGSIAGQDVECEYNLAAFSLPNENNLGVSHFSMEHCADDVTLHMVGKAYLSDPVGYTGTWEGSYHYDPQ